MRAFLIVYMPAYCGLEEMLKLLGQLKLLQQSQPPHLLPYKVAADNTTGSDVNNNI